MKPVVPVLLGPPIPRQDRVDTNERYYRSIITLFVPWRSILDLCDINQTEKQAFQLKCVQNGTQLVYASLEGFVSLLSDLGNGQHQGLSDVSLSFERTHIGPTLLMILRLFNVWKSFATKGAQLGSNNISTNAGQ